MVQQLDVQQLEAWCKAHAPSKALVLDVRESWEVQTASIPAEHFDVQTIALGELVQRLDELPRGRPIACLCHHGMRSLQAARFLEQQGFQEVVNLQGGIDAWSLRVDSSVPRY